MYFVKTFEASRLSILAFTRAFFKKWLDLEYRLGDAEGAAAVKQKAIEWTRKATNSS
jgi:hypothetical protein